MLFDIFVQLSDYKLAVAISKMIFNICGHYNPMFGCDSFISSPTGHLIISSANPMFGCDSFKSSPTGHLFYSRLNGRSG